MNIQLERSVRPRRSFIFTSGLDPAMFPKALASGADIVCVELFPCYFKAGTALAPHSFDHVVGDTITNPLRYHAIREWAGHH